MAITASNLLVDIYEDFQVQKTKRTFIQQSQCYQAWLQFLTGKTQLLTPKTRKGQLILLPISEGKMQQKLSQKNVILMLVLQFLSPSFCKKTFS